MTDKNQYIHLGRLNDEEKNDKKCLDLTLSTIGMTFKEKVKFNLDPETLKNRLEYYSLCVKEYFGRN